MTQTIAVDTRTIEKILSRLDELRQDMNELKEKLMQDEPPYGSAEWWKWSEKQADEDIKKNDAYDLRDKKELSDFFNNIRSGASNEKYHNKVRR